MKFAPILISILIIGVLSGCKEDPGFHVDKYNEIKIESLQEDVKIPAQAWDIIEMKPIKTAHESPKEEKKAEGEGAKEGGEGSAKSNVIFSEVTVFLVEKNESIVDGQAIKIKLPKGGGTIDLAKYISQAQGSFYVGFEFPAFAEATDKKVLFVSSARKRKIGPDMFGSGCNQFFDITDKFFAKMLGEGIKVNTTQARYLTVLGGSFLFSAKKNQDIEIAKVTFTNSQYLPLFCEEK